MAAGGGQGHLAGTAPSHLFSPLQERYLLPDYMKDQPDITTDMRAILVDWMVEVQVGVRMVELEGFSKSPLVIV